MEDKVAVYLTSQSEKVRAHTHTHTHTHKIRFSHVKGNLYSNNAFFDNNS